MRLGECGTPRRESRLLIQSLVLERHCHTRSGWAKASDDLTGSERLRGVERLKWTSKESLHGASGTRAPPGKRRLGRECMSSQA